MKITVGKDNFNNIGDFTDYLETKYEQDKLVSEEVTVFLNCNEFHREDLSKLVDFLSRPERTRLYKFEVIPLQMRYQLAFDNAYLISKRQKFSFEFQQQIAELFNSVFFFILKPIEFEKLKRIGLMA
ncbi:hypothetical protein lpari_01593 [Legionella parisiensis]|uniref:Uncharacterized protein n=1 Tax=Legionella parisiensis TaxID=45071 RepID=A0A1E5JSE0_9GAMM|nr:hypothetical protein [Legionella parisiensis]OEH47425.1 hypothetical protein lpari_01593 [Legionella parisiensis]